MFRQDFIKWCCDRVFYVVAQSTRNRRLLVATEEFYVAAEFVQSKSFLVATECFYVAIELAMVERLYVVTRYFMSLQSVAKWRCFVLLIG